MSNVLDVSQLSVVQTSAGVEIITDVGFSLRAGEILALVGESGSGKTTAGLAILGHCRSGLEIAPSSYVGIEGNGVLKAVEQRLRELRRSLVSYVPQDPGTALNPALRIKTQLRECLSPDDLTSRERPLELLRDVGLPSSEEFLRRFPHQMSGGQQQRVAIAMAFAGRPRVVVMDEPTTGLDVSTQAQILRIIRNLCERHGTAVVYISHDLAVVSQLATRVAVMYAGRIVEEGTTRRVLGSPAHPYTAALVRAVPTLEQNGILLGIPGQAPDPGARPSGCSFHPRCSGQVRLCMQEVPEARRLSADHVVHCHSPLAGKIEGVVPQPRSAKDLGAQLLKIHDLCASHGEMKVLHSVGFGVNVGECLAIVGESGSGKTTLARCVAGLHDVYEGSIRFGGVEMGKGRNRQRIIRKEIQYIFQNPYASLNPRRTIGESIEETLLTLEDISGDEKRLRIHEALAAVALSPSFATKYPRELSGGQRQRVAIARALVVKPKLLICDEITSALDVSIQALIVTLIENLKREHGLSVIFVTHNLALIESIAEDVVVLAGGRVLESGDVRSVLRNPQSDYARRLIADTPKFYTY